MLVAVVGLVFAPVLVLVIFSLATVHHFGEADAQFRQSSQFSERRTQLIEQLWILARGSLILNLPLWLWSANSAAIVNDVLTLVGSQTAIATDTLYQLGLIGFVLAIVIQPLVLMWDGIEGSELFETACLIAALTLLPPLLSLGLYFLLWHSTRHLYELSTSLETRRQTTFTDHLRSLASLQIKALPLRQRRSPARLV